MADDLAAGRRDWLVCWQCSETPNHRGWRTPDEPRGTCDYCLAVTRWEQEFAEAVERELAPKQKLPENRFPALHPDGPPTA